MTSWKDLLNEPVSAEHKKSITDRAAMELRGLRPEPATWSRRWLLLAPLTAGLAAVLLTRRKSTDSEPPGESEEFAALNLEEELQDPAQIELLEELDLIEELEVLEKWPNS